MILREDWEEAYELMCFITDSIPALEQGYKDRLLQDKCPAIAYFEYKVQYISIGTGTSDAVQSSLKFNSINSYSFVRGKEHRAAGVNIHFAYRPSNHIRLGQIVTKNFDYSEENIFQQSLVLDNEMVEDLEFICFLRKKKFNKTLIFKRRAYSLEGLKMIKDRVEEALCYLSEKK